MGYVLSFDPTSDASRCSHSPTHARKYGRLSSFERSSSHDRRSARPSSCCPHSFPRTSPIRPMRAWTCRSICRAQRTFPATGGTPRADARSAALDDSYRCANLAWRPDTASPTVSMSWSWNSLTAARTRVRLSRGLKRAKTRNMSSASWSGWKRTRW